MAPKTRHVLNSINVLCLLMLACASLLSNAANAQQVPPVDVKVSVEPSSGFTTYRYRVINNGAHAITGLQVGFDYYHGAPELKTIPLNSQGDLSQPFATSPTGWDVVMNATEDTDNVDLEWSVTNVDAAIAPGQSLAGFSVRVPGSDPSYVNSHWTVSLNGGGDVAFFAPLSLERSCSPPRLSVSVSPSILWPPNHKMVPISATISVKDDVDQNPLVTLDSIESNEPGNPHDVSANIGTGATTFSLMSSRTGSNKAGRVYTITYSARNYCGSTAIATATVTVPHDKGM